MPRGRWLKPEFFRDRKMVALGPAGALVYQALWIIADDGGMAPCDLNRLKGEMLFAWDVLGVAEITEALALLFALGRVKFYSGGDELFCQIVNWAKHQWIHKPSRFRYRDHYAKQGKEFTEVVPEWCRTSDGGDRHSPSLRLQDSKTPRLQESQLHRDASRRLPGVDQAYPSKTRRATWLTPYWDAWVSVYGGEPKSGQLAKALKPLHEKRGLEKTLAHWQNYLARTEASYASPAKFAATFGSWETSRAYRRQDPRDPRPGESADAYLTRATGETPRG